MKTRPCLSALASFYTGGFLCETKNNPVTVGFFLCNWPCLHKFPPGISPFRGQRFLQRLQRAAQRSQGLYKLKSRLPGQGRACPPSRPRGQVRSVVSQEPQRGSGWTPRGPAEAAAQECAPPSRVDLLAQSLSKGTGALSSTCTISSFPSEKRVQMALELLSI